MRDIRVATAQFETRDNDREYNLGRIRELTRIAAEKDAEIVSFHESCIPAYTWLQTLSKSQLLDVAETVPEGSSVGRLIEIAREFNIVVMAGIMERDAAENVYNTYVTVGPQGFIAKYRKLHPFINQNVSSGDRYVVIDLLGCKIGFSICYDNNLPENVRATTLLGAEIIFMPHVTGCLPSIMPGRGYRYSRAMGKPPRRSSSTSTRIPWSEGASMAASLASNACLGKRHLRRF